MKYVALYLLLGYLAMQLAHFHILRMYPAKYGFAAGGGMVGLIVFLPLVSMYLVALVALVALLYTLSKLAHRRVHAPTNAAPQVMDT